MSYKAGRLLNLILRSLLAAAGTLIIIVGTGLLLYKNGCIVPNDPKHEKVRGVDVSSYQGKIDWQVLSENVDFAYIKATEGSGSVDPQFNDNYSNSLNTDIRIGFYMFFSFDSGGDTQAENYIRNVSKFDNMLPPAIDVEFYADKEQNPPSREDVNRELDILIEKLEAYYGVKPIIYSTQKAYDMYISGGYEDCDIWISDIFCEPELSDKRNWTFWQYSEKGRLDGYDGDEQFIDMNVFCGTPDEFSKYPK